MADLPLTKTALSYSGSAETYTVTQAGTLRVKLWGAGGGGAVRTTANWPEEGGTGGFTYIEIPVEIGDEIEISVGQGGRSAASTTTGGLGGWPDGGSGGVPTTSGGVNTLLGCAGGGGSTRVKLNGVLVAVAGAGGGGVNFFPGGHGGGEEGLQNQSIESPALALVSGNRFNGASYHATGGTQSAGGYAVLNPTNVASTGTQSSGGNGWRDSAGNGTTPDAGSGAGGGGGYWGGGGGCSTGDFAPAGGGGSGYVAGGYTGFTRTGRDVRAAPYDVDPDYVDGVGKGSLGVTSFGSNPAGNGLAVIEYALPELDGSVVEVQAYPFDQEFTVDETCPPILDFYLWGGAGAGGQRPMNAANSTSAPALTTAGGAGGATFVSLMVEPGDVIRLSVGQGGEVGRITVGGEPANINAVGYTGVGGLGGWPDGGQGGATRYGAWGGGGGATYLYLNDVLIAVAGGGGGAGVGDTNRVAGAGGGEEGETGTNAQTPSYQATGGTQSDGGVSGAFPSDASLTGAQFDGGNGYRYTENATSNGGTTHVSGGGGGGGYYGGAGGSNPVGASTGLGPPGGGGSGYLNTAHAAFVSGALYAGVDNVPPQTAHPRYPANAAIGGQARWSENSTYAGGDGVAIIAADSVLVDDYGTIEYTGGAVFWIAPATGVLSVKEWGGGGAAAWRANGTMGDGGPGGYAEAEITVLAGDLVKFEVAQGGLAGNGSPATGGLGGWPDGGNAGWAGTAGYRGGGGGGSTRVWVNDVLKLVAGGGGGGGRTSSDVGGAGGGSSGENANLATGGSQVGGGTNASGDTQMQGDYLYGGLGYPSGQSNSVRYDLAGSGGGGGYYGGAGGYDIDSADTGGGGGGSGYDASGSGTLTASSTQTPPNTADPDYISGVAAAGVANTSGSVAAGGNGLIVYSFSAVAPGEGLGDIDTINLTSPTAGVQVGEPTGDLATIEMTAPTGQGGNVGEAEGALDTIEMQMFLSTSPVASASLNIPIVDYDIDLTPPNVAPGAEASITVAFPGPIRFTPPRAYIDGFAVSEAFENDIVLSVIEAIAEEGVEGFGDLDTIDLTSPEADVEGSVEIDPVEATPYFSRLLLSTPTGSAGTSNATGAIGTIPLSTPNGVVDVFADAVGEAFPDDIVLTSPEAVAEEGSEAFGQALDEIMLQMDITGDVSAGASVTSGGVGYFARLILSAVQAAASGGLSTTGSIGEIALLAAEGTASLGAYVYPAILPARIVLRAPNGLGYEGDGALAIGDLLADDAYITMTAPEGLAQVTPQIVFPEILLDYVDGYVEVDIPGFEPIRFKRSITPGAVPTLEANEIALNEHDGMLYTRDASGNVIGTDYLGLSKGWVAPTGGTTGAVLNALGSWVSPDPEEVSAILPDPPAGDVAFLGIGFDAAPASPVSGTVYYSPFFLPRAIELTTFGVTVLTPSAAVAHYGVCRWTPGEGPGDTVFSGSSSTSTSGEKTTSQTITLNAGWYAGMFALQGTAGATFDTLVAPKEPDATFSLKGSQTATFTGSLGTPPAPDSRADDAWIFLKGTVANA